jgi:hypothetical protein
MIQSISVSCGWCGGPVTLDDALSPEGLPGRYCGEVCAILYIKQHPNTNTFFQMNQTQMGTERSIPSQHGSYESETAQPDDTTYSRRNEGDWQ